MEHSFSLDLSYLTGLDCANSARTHGISLTVLEDYYAAYLDPSAYAALVNIHKTALSRVARIAAPNLLVDAGKPLWELIKSEIGQTDQPETTELLDLLAALPDLVIAMLEEPGGVPIVNVLTSSFRYPPKDEDFEVVPSTAVSQISIDKSLSYRRGAAICSSIAAHQQTRMVIKSNPQRLPSHTKNRFQDLLQKTIRVSAILAATHFLIDSGAPLLEFVQVPRQAAALASIIKGVQPVINAMWYEPGGTDVVANLREFDISFPPGLPPRSHQNLSLN